MTIKEAIKQFKEDAEYNRADLDLEWAEENEQVAKWLEELEELRKCVNSTAFKDGYNKAIADVKRVVTESMIPRQYQDAVCRLIDNEFGKGEEDV